jgi:hypothetical protein
MSELGGKAIARVVVCGHQTIGQIRVKPGPVSLPWGKTAQNRQAYIASLNDAFTLKEP